MRAVITRVNEASVTIGGQETARIGKGFLVLLGVHVSDTAAEADRIVDRICGLRVFEDEAGKMNVNPTDAGAELLIVSQFTHLKSVTITIYSITVSIVVSLTVYKCYCSMSCITIPAIITIVFSYTVFKIIAFT